VKILVLLNKNNKFSFFSGVRFKYFKGKKSHFFKKSEIFSFRVNQENEILLQKKKENENLPLLFKSVFTSGNILILL